MSESARASRKTHVKIQRISAVAKQAVFDTQTSKVQPFSAVVPLEPNAKKSSTDQRPEVAAMKSANDNAVHHAEIIQAEFTGTVDFGTGPTVCYNTSNGDSYLTTRGIQQILLGQNNGSLKRSIERVLPDRQASPVVSVRVRLPSNNSLANGMSASVLVDICELYVSALRAGTLRDDQRPIADRATIVLAALARRGLDALIWEATGYEKVKEQDLHQRRLSAWLNKEAAPWERMFSLEYYIELSKLYRLRWDTHSGRRPNVFAQFTAKYVYEWFDREVCPGALQAIRDKNPDPTEGVRHHQFLTALGRLDVRQRIDTIVMLMRVSSDPVDFKMRFNAAFNSAPLQLPLAASVSQ